MFKLSQIWSFKTPLHLHTKAVSALLGISKVN